MMGKQYKPVPEMECLKYHGTFKNPDVKIFVSHRIDLDSTKIDNSIYIPVRCGAIFDKRNDITMLGDDTGENISARRMSFCELTVQYWAWKNINADYYGLCHYRRYLSCAEKRYPADAFGNVLEAQLSDASIKRYELLDGRIEEMCKNYDILLPEVQDVSAYPKGYTSVWEQYSDADQLNEKDLNIIVDIIREMYPNYLTSAKAYLYGTKAYVCNLFVMRKDIFLEYSEWLFSILEEFCRRSDMSAYTVEGLRTPGHLAERLLGIFICYQREIKVNLQIKELQPVVFFETENKQDKEMEKSEFSLIKKAYDSNNIAIVLSSSDFYAPYAASVVQSIIDHKSLRYNYDILCIESEMSDISKRMFKSMCDGGNVSIRVISIGAEWAFQKVNIVGYFSIETYFRLLLPYFLPEYEKVIWLDSDTLVQTDIAELFAVNIKGNLLAAAMDYNAAALRNGMDVKYGEFCKEELGMESADRYFQAGVLIINLAEFRKAYKMEEIVSLIGQQAYPYADQDILNKLCLRRILWLDDCWNVIADVEDCLSNVLNYWGPAGTYAAYQAAKEAPKIIHYAGPTKPWHSPKNFMADRFWTTCRKTPFYEIALVRMLDDIKNGILRYGMECSTKEEHKNVRPSLIKRALRCLRENGFQYTILKVFSFFKN